jgi:hypothetical protein
MHQVEGSQKKDLLITVAPLPKEDSHIAFKRMDISHDHTFEEGEISEYEIVTSNEAKMGPEKQLKSGEAGYSALDHDGVPNNGADTNSDRGCEHEDETDNAPDREATEFSDEPEQHSPPIFQSRVNSANGVATLQVLGFAVGKELIVHLPDITAFQFSKQHIEDFYPVRLQIGVCDNSKIGILSHLWIYLKWTKPSPQVDYIISGTVSARDASLVTELSNEERRSIPHGQLWRMLNEDKAELYPFFRHFGTQRQELQALAKYGYVLAAESHGVDFSNHNIPMNLTFETHLQKVCRKFQSEPVDYWSRDFSLSAQPREKDRDRSNSINQFAAIDAESAEHINHNQLPLKPRKAIDRSSDSLNILPMRPGSGSPSHGNNMEIEDLQLAETRRVIPVLPSRARYSQTPHPDDFVLEDDTPRADVRLPALHDRTLTVSDNENGDKERPKSKTPVLARLSASVRSASARTNAIREQAFNHRASSGSRSASVRRTSSMQHIPSHIPIARFHTRETTKKHFAKLLEGRRVLGRRVKKDREEGNKNRAGILNLLVKKERLRVRANRQNDKLSRINHKLEELLKQALEESSHEFDLSEWLSFKDYTSDAFVNGDNPGDEEVSMHDDNSGEEENDDM